MRGLEGNENNILREALSPSEEKFERWRKGIGLFAGPFTFTTIYLISIPSLSKEAHTLAAVSGLVLIFWLSEAIPTAITAVLGAILNIVLGVAPAKAVFAPFADPIIFLGS